VAVEAIKKAFEVLTVTFLASVLLIFLGIVYFGITLWVMKIASNVFFGTGLQANWAVLSAAILSTGAILAGALEKKR
jgi:hypothetical protein